MAGAAFGRELQCRYDSHYYTLRPSYERCSTSHVDYSEKFETEKHSFSGSSAQKSELKAFQIWHSPQVDFIPLDILTEFPNLNGLGVGDCNLPTLKSKLFKKELQKIEFLYLDLNKIEVIEAGAFQYLVNLKWIRLRWNKLQSLSDQLFVNNPDLIYIDFFNNEINSIHPNFFDGLQKLKLIDFDYNLCIKSVIGCETCQITQSELKEKLQECFENCQNDTICLDSYSAQETSESPKVIPKTTESPMEIETTVIVTQKSEEIEEPQTKDPSPSSTAEPETEPLNIKLAFEGTEQKFTKIIEKVRTAEESLGRKIEEESNNVIEKVKDTLMQNRDQSSERNLQKQRDLAIELLNSKLENEKLKVRVSKLEAELAKKEIELKSLKRDIDLEERMAQMQERLDEIDGTLLNKCKA
jgi:hypothetical protein